MRDRRLTPALLLSAIVLLALHLGAAQPTEARAAAPTQARLAFPLIRNGQVAAHIVTLDEDDSTFVGVDEQDGRTILTYIDRAHGNRLLIVEDIGERIVDLPVPPLLQAQLDLAMAARAPPAPQFTTPGDKQAAGVPLLRNGVLSVYFTGRDVGDAVGPFKLKKLIMALPPPPQLVIP